MADGFLAEHLRRLQWSPEDLAHRLNARHGPGTVGTSTPYAWLSGRIPRGQLPHQVADLLSERGGHSVEAADLWPGLTRPRARTAGMVFATGWTEEILRAATQVILRGATLFPPTRSTLEQLVRSWLAEPFVISDAPVGGAPRTEQVLALLATKSVTLREFDDRHGGLSAYILAEHELSLAARLIVSGRYASTVGIAMYQVFAELCADAGYVALDAGRRGAAFAYWVTGLRAARLAGDSSTAAYLLALMSLALTTTGEHELGVRFAETAVRTVRDAPVGAVHFVAAVCEAFTLAGVGSDTDTRRALDQAGRFFLDQQPAATPPCARNSTMLTIDTYTGLSLVRLNLIDEAHQHLLKTFRTAVAEGWSRRASSTALVLARAALRQREETTAIMWTHQAIDLGRNLRSDTVARSAAGLLHELGQRRSPAAREAGDHLRAYLTATGSEARQAPWWALET